MARPISYVTLDLAEFSLEVGDAAAGVSDGFPRFPEESPEAYLVRWILTLRRALARRDPSLHPYAARLLSEASDYRKADSERKRASRENNIRRIPDISGGNPPYPPESPLIHTSTHSSIQKDQEDKSAGRPARPPGSKGGKAKKEKPAFAPMDPPYRCALMFDTFRMTWGPGATSATEADLQRWAGTFELMVRKDGRTWHQISDMLELIDKQEPEGPKKFRWAPNILSADTLRENWNKGKLGKFVEVLQNAA